MQPGRLVFPIIMVGFVLFFFGFVLTTPVNEASDAPDSRFTRARDGDSVLIEFTAYYGEAGGGFAFFSTQEERADSLKVGTIAPSIQEQPIAIHLAADEPAGGLRTNLLGKRAGDKFTTGLVAPADAFGDWERDVTLPRMLAELMYQVRFDAAVPVGPGQTFNATQYLSYWQSQGFTLQAGTIWPCEGDELWDCRVDEVSTAKNEFVYTRLVKVGDTYPVAPVWGNLAVGGDMTWDFSIADASDAEGFSIRLNPPVGTRFQFVQNAGGDFVAGTYLVTSVGEDTFEADYTSATPRQPELIGATVYYDVDVVSVTRRA
jgi:FKBP-type peptidyl-prolyl cis-trans isomerase 2